MWTKKQNCRACGGTDLTEVFSFGKPMPLANDWKGPGEASEGYFPLTVLLCAACRLSFLREVVNPHRLYDSYLYTTSRSETMRRHFEDLLSAIRKESSASNVMEIASNDGHLLQFFKEHGVDAVVGVDPAENLCKEANTNGITTICGLFDSDTARIVSGVMPSIDAIVARHVFAHIDDWGQFIKDLDSVSQRDTLVVLEVPWVVDTLNSASLDVLYHEHLSYVSVHSVAALLKGTPFHLHKVSHVPIHGGAIILMLRKNHCQIYPDASVGAFLADENITAQTWQDFKDHANAAIHFLKLKVDELLGTQASRATGVTIAGYGASAKSTVWISACGFTSKEISFICDCTPGKQGKFSPGTDIPIVPEIELMKQRPDYCIIWAWNYAQEIILKNREYIAAGGHFIVPGMRLRII